MISRLAATIAACSLVAAATAAPAAATPVPVVYPQEQGVDLYSSAAYLGVSVEELHVSAAGVHHFLLGMAGKLEHPSGGCELDLAPTVDASTGRIFVDVDFAGSPSNAIVAEYYCLTASQAAKVNVTLLVFLVGIDRNARGIPFTPTHPPAQPQFTIIAPTQTDRYDASGALQLRTTQLIGAIRDTTLKLVVVFAEGNPGLCASVQVDGPTPLSGVVGTTPSISCAGAVGEPLPTTSWVVENLLIIDTEMPPDSVVDAVVTFTSTTGSARGRLEAFDLDATLHPVAPVNGLIGIAGSSQLLRRTAHGDYLGVRGSGPPVSQGSCVPSHDSFCALGDHVEVHALGDDVVAVGPPGEVYFLARDASSQYNAVITAYDDCPGGGFRRMHAEFIHGAPVLGPVTGIVALFESAEGASYDNFGAACDLD